MESGYFKKAMQKNKYKLNVGIAINLIHKKTKKAAMSKLVVSSGEKFTRSCLYPNGNWTKQSNQQLKEIYYFYNIWAYFTPPWILYLTWINCLTWSFGDTCFS